MLPTRSVWSRSTCVGRETGRKTLAFDRNCPEPQVTKGCLSVRTAMTSVSYRCPCSCTGMRWGSRVPAIHDNRRSCARAGFCVRTPQRVYPDLARPNDALHARRNRKPTPRWPRRLRAIPIIAGSRAIPSEYKRSGDPRVSRSRTTALSRGVGVSDCRNRRILMCTARSSTPPPRCARSSPSPN
jgi:hypothetical protein